MFQGVHMILDGDHQRAWKDGEKRDSRSSSSAATCRKRKSARVSRLRAWSSRVIRGASSAPCADSSGLPSRMTLQQPNTPSVVERTRAVAAGAPVVAVHFLGRTAAFVLGEEAVLLVADKGDEQRLARAWRRHPVGGDRRRARRHRRRRRQGVRDRRQGRKPAGRDRCQAPLDRPRRAGPDGAVAWSAGKTGLRADRQGRAAHRSRCRPPSAGSPSRRRACGSPSRITTA